MAVSKNSIVPKKVWSTIYVDEHGEPFDGDTSIGEITLRFYDGLLHAEGEESVNQWPHIEYWQNGKLHNTKCPAIYNNDTKFEEFWINGVQQESGISWAKEYDELMERSKTITKDSIVRASMIATLFLNEQGKPYTGDHFENSTIFRFKNGLLHGGDEASVEFYSHIEYWVHGKLHGNPAIIDIKREYEAVYEHGVFVSSNTEWKK